MQCLKTDSRLSAWMDGELEPGAASDVAAHVEACAECADFVDACRSVPLPDVEPDPGFIVRFREARSARTSEPLAGYLTCLKWKKLAFGLVPLAAAMLVAAILVVSSTDGDAIQQIELEALGDPVALEAGAESVLTIAIEPFPDELP